MRWTLPRAVENMSVQLEVQGETGGVEDAVMSLAAARVTVTVVLIEEGKRAFLFIGINVC